MSFLPTLEYQRLTHRNPWDEDMISLGLVRDRKKARRVAWLFPRQKSDGSLVSAGKKGLISPLFFLSSLSVWSCSSRSITFGCRPTPTVCVRNTNVRSNQRYRSYRPPPKCHDPWRHEQTTVLTKWKRVDMMDINFCLKILAVLIWLLIILAILKTLSQLNLNSHFWFALDPMTVEFVA